MHDVFARWNTGPLDSYLIEITRDILGFRDAETGKPMVDLILDTAGQKGTGKWTVTSALDLGVPLTLIAEAVFARCLSAQKEERVAASKVLRGPRPSLLDGNPQTFVDDIEMALYASKIISYAQGYALMDAMAAGIGLGDQQRRRRPDVAGRLHHPQRLPRQDQGSVRPQSRSSRTCCSTPTSRSEVQRAQEGWRRVVAAAVTQRDPAPGHVARPWPTSTATAASKLPANLLQAQRDYFGAHTYERVDRPRGQFFHTNWTGRGGTTSSTSYNV